jgi:predicted transcriptional regulator
MSNVSYHTGGHTDDAIKPAFELLERVLSDPRMGLDDREVTVNYAGRDRGHGRRSPYAIQTIDRPPSSAVTLLVQPRGNDTCAKYKVMAAGMTAMELSERLDGFSRYVVRSGREYRILSSEEKPVAATMTIRAARTKQYSEAVRELMMEELRRSGLAGRKSQDLTRVLRASFPESSGTTIGVLMQPLVTKGLVEKEGRYLYRLRDAAPDPEALELATKTGRIKRAILDFLPTRPEGAAAADHLRQRVSTVVGRVNEACFQRALRDLVNARRIRSVGDGRYGLEVEEPEEEPAAMEPAEEAAKLLSAASPEVADLLEGVGTMLTALARLLRTA